jgi:hypothetical protein
MRGTLGVAACVTLAAVILALTLRSSIAFADVLDKIEKTRTLTMEVKEDDGVSRVYFKGDRVRAEYPRKPDAQGNGASIGDVKTGEWLALDAPNKAAIRLRMRAIAFDFYGILKDFKDGKEERLPPTQLNGKNVLTFRITRDLPNPAKGGDKEPVQITLWVDPATSFPVEAEMNAFGNAARLINLQWDRPLDDALFSMEVPADWTVTDMGGVLESRLKAASTAPADQLEIKPGVGIGDLKFGDSPSRIEALLGKPESIRSNIDWGYPSRGIFILVHPTGGVSLITLYSKKAAGPFPVNDFTGKTAEGIAMGSSRDAVLKVFGNPTREENGILYYDDKGLWLTLADNQVTQIVLHPLKSPSNLP